MDGIPERDMEAYVSWRYSFCLFSNIGFMYEDVTIKDFSDAWFKEKYDKLSKDDFETCYSEYIDAAGLFATEEFDIVANIHYLNNRINSVKLWVDLQKKFINIFAEPYQEAFKFINKFGHKLKWNNDIENFINQLDLILVKESKYQVEFDKKQKQLLDARKKRGNQESNPKQSREQFLMMLNSLGKIGYKIDKNETTVEELALMLKQQEEENQKYAGR